MRQPIDDDDDELPPQLIEIEAPQALNPIDPPGYVLLFPGRQGSFLEIGGL
jgi:hypothetical protein